MKKRILSLLLVFCMVASMLIPANAAIQTGEYYGYYNKSNDTRGQDLFMDALCIVSGDGQTWNNLHATLRDKVGYNAYEVLQKDLNDEAGGDYVYLGWTTTTDPNKAITGVKILNHTGDNPPKTITSNGVTWYLANAGAEGSVAPRIDNWSEGGGAADLNEGAGGDYLFLYVTKDPNYGLPLSAIHFTNSSADPGNGYDKVLNFDGGWQDVNEDAGGQYIYLTVSTDLEVIDSADVAALRDLVARAEKLMKAGGYNISADDSDYKRAKYDILQKWNGTKYANGYRVTPTDVSNAVDRLRDHIENTTTTITFDAAANGGKIYGGNTTKSTPKIGENTTVKVDVSTIMPTPKSGYEFVGWSTNKNDTTGSKTTVTAKPGATYYAIYRKEITVDFKYYYQNHYSTTETVTAYLYNNNATTSVNLPDDVQAVGDHGGKIYTFVGWRTDAEPAEPQYTGNPLQLSGNTTLNGIYSVPVVLSFETYGGTEIEPMVVDKYFNIGEVKSSQVSFTLPTVETPPAGFRFTGWNTVENYAPGYLAGGTFSCYIDYTMYAYYNAIEYAAAVTIGDATTYHETMDAAFVAAKAGTADAPATVTLLKDVDTQYTTLGGTVVLDLNGHTFSGRLNAANNTTLTIRDTDGNGIITGAGDENHTLFVDGGSKVILESGVIRRTGEGNTVSVYGDFEMTGGEIAGNTAIYASTSDSTVSISGGKIEGQATLLSSDVTISGGTFKNFTIADNGSTTVITGGTFTDGITSVATSAERTPTPLSKFLAEGYGFYTEQKVLVNLTDDQTEITETVTVKKPCAAHVPGTDGNCTACGELIVASSTVADTTVYHIELQEALDAAMAGTEDAPGLVTLMQDITIGYREAYGMEGHEWIDGVGIFDLNGHTLNHLDETSVGRAAILVRKGQLTIRDSGIGGTIYSTSGYNSGAMGVTGSGHLILESGTLRSDNPEFYAVFVENGTFTMNGGEVDGVDGISVVNGGLAAADIILNGGKLTAERVALTLNSNTRLTVTDGSLHGGYAALLATDAEKIEIAGGTFSSDRTPIVVEGATYTYELLNIGGSTETVITGGTFMNRFAVLTNMDEMQNLNTVLPAGYGFYDLNDALVTLTADQTVIEHTVTVKEAAIPAVPHIHCACGTENCGETGDGHTAPVTFTPWTSTDSLPTDSGSYYLTEDVNLTTAWEVRYGANIHLCLNGHSITQNGNDNCIEIGGYRTLAISDCGTTGKITHASGAEENAVMINGSRDSALFILYGGSITGYTYDGVMMNGGTFRMYGGCIDGTDSYKGIGIYIQSGSDFYLYDGSITGNAYGGVCVNFGCNFYLYGGSITNNGEDGVSVRLDGKLHVYGGSVIDNSAANVRLASSSSLITIGADLTGSVQIGVTKPIPEGAGEVAITEAYATDCSAYFFDDTKPGQTDTVSYHDGQLWLSAAEDTYIVAGMEELCGSNWDGFDLNNQMTKDGEVYKLVFPGVAVGDNYQIKVVKNGTEWIGDPTGSNITFHVKSICDVTVTYDPATDEITVTGSGVEIPTDLEIVDMYAVGNGNGNWLSDSMWDPSNTSNRMTEISEKVYQIKYENVPEGSGYQVKFAANGSWADNWAGTFSESGTVTGAEYNAYTNITFDVTYAFADITLTLDLSGYNHATKQGATFIVSIEEAANAPTPTPTHTHCVCGGDVNTGDHTTHGSVGYDTEWSGDRGSTVLSDGTYHVVLTGDTHISGSLYIMNSTVDLCLNGYTLSLDGSVEVSETSTLSICDCSADETGKIIADSSIFIIVYENCTLNLYGGTVQNTLAGDAQSIISYGTVNLYGGTVSSVGYYTIYTISPSVVNMYGGRVENTGAELYDYVIYNNFGCTLNISDGTVTGNDAHYVIYNSGSTTITGGTVENSGFTSTAASTIMNAGGRLTITDGTVTGSYETALLNNETGTVEITGGTISSVGECVLCNYGTANLSGGDLSGGTKYTIYNTGGTMSITGGTITGSGLRVIMQQRGGLLNLAGGTVTTGGSESILINEGSFYLSGSPVISNGEVAMYLAKAKIYGHAWEDETALYEGTPLTVRCGITEYAEGAVCVYESTDTTRFALPDGKDDYILVSDGTNLVMQSTHTHIWSEDWSRDESAHWHDCDSSDCFITANSRKDGYGTHTASADDGDCTTPSTCTTCGYILTLPNSHSYTDGEDTDCNNEGCTHVRVFDHIHEDGTKYTAVEDVYLYDGRYYLTEDVADGLQISGNATLCLNGKSISGIYDYCIIVDHGAALTICDCHEGTVDDPQGEIKGNFAGIFNQSRVTFNSGKISSDYCGIYNYGGALTMNGGTITSGDMGIVLENTILTVNGGTIDAPNYSIYDFYASTIFLSATPQLTAPVFLYNRPLYAYAENADGTRTEYTGAPVRLELGTDSEWKDAVVVYGSENTDRFLLENGDDFDGCVLNPVEGNLVLSEKVAVALDTPANLTWNGTTAKWDGVAGASGYSVALYKDGTAQGSPVTVTEGTSYTFPITETGSYTFKVTAIGDNVNYTDSETAEGEALVLHSVAYDANLPAGEVLTDGSVPTDDNLYASGHIASVQFPEINRLGHVFLGWSEDREATAPTFTEFGTDTFTVTKNTVLYAVWGQPDLSSATVTLPAEELTYNGKAHTPEVKVVLDGVTLTAGVDFEVSYGSNIDAGPATVTVTGINRYNGTVTKNFTISPAKLEIASVDYETSKTYDGTDTLEVSGVRFTNNTPSQIIFTGDYTVSGKYESANAGEQLTGTVTVTLTDAVSRNFIAPEPYTVSGLEIKPQSVNWNINFTVVTYDGIAKVPGSGDISEPTLSGMYRDDDLGLTLDVIGDNVNAGTFTLKAGTLTGADAGNYRIDNTEETVEITIRPKMLTVTHSGSDTKVYDGTTAAPTVSLQLSGVIPADDGKVEFNYGVPQYEEPNVGTRLIRSDVSLSGEKSSNYYLESDIYAFRGEITKATYDMSAVTFTDATYTFDNEEKALVIGGTLPDGVTVTYENNTLTNVGTVTATAKFSGDSTNYKPIELKTATLTITNATFSVSAVGYDGVYDGKPHTISVTADGATITYSTDGETYTAECPTFTNAGTYTVYYKAVKANHDDVNGSATVKIAKATPVLTIKPSQTSLLGGGRVVFTVTGAPEEGLCEITCIPAIKPHYDGSFTLPNDTLTYLFTVTCEESANYTSATASCTVSTIFYIYNQTPTYYYYTLSFDTNGGTAISPITGVSGATIDLTAYTPRMDGYIFEGWYSDTGLSDKISSVRLTKNTTVYAGWTMIEEFSPIEPMPIVNPFKDISEIAWYYDDVMYVYDNGLMNGTAVEMFSPELSTTRGMIVTILYRLEGEPDTYGLDTPFVDLTEDWYVDAVKWAAVNGIVKGYGNGKYGPDDLITREQMATILWRYAKYKDIDVSVGENTNILSYNDAFEISEYAISAMQWACGEGIIQGYNGNLMPGDKTQRCQVAAIFRRFCELIEE